jgi:hypothetical protein
MRLVTEDQPISMDDLRRMTAGRFGTLVDRLVRR